MTDPKLKPLLSDVSPRPLRFALVGECMVEMSPAADPATYRMAFAGDTFNTAYYLKALQPDWTARYVTRVGRDAVSDDMVAMMTSHGVDTSHVQRSDDRSVGLYLIALQDGERSFSYWRDRSAARLLAADPALLATAFADMDVIYFSGITMAILEGAGRETLLAALAAARAAGTTIAFDSNLRPRLWASGDEMCTAIMQAAAVSDIVLPSYDDEADHFGDADMHATRARYLAAGATTVVVKNGAGQIVYAHGDRTGLVTPPPVKQVVDTTSAGDSFNAGVFAGLGRGLDIEDAILLAAGVARQVIGQKGALIADVG